MPYQSNITQYGVIVGDANLAIKSTATGTTGQVLSAVTGGEPIWAIPPANSVVGNATSFFLDTTASLADNYTLSTSPSTYPEVINSKAVTAATSPVFFERFVSGALGRTSFSSGAWIFHIHAAINNIAGTNTVDVRINKRVEQTAMTGTFTGAGPTRTFTVTGGAPFVPGDANASRLLANLIETPTQTAWISGFTSSSVVTVTLTDPAFVNVAGVALNAIYYYLFSDSTPNLTATGVTEYVVTSVQPEFTGLTVTDRIVAAFFATSSANRTMSLYYGGQLNFTYFTTPLATLTTLTGNSGGVISASNVNNFNVVGTGSVTTVGTTNTITAQLTGLTNHALQVGAGTSTLTQLGLGTAGQVLRSGGAGADPAYSTATYPATAGTTGNVITSNGTNFDSTAPAASSKITTYTGNNTWTKDARTKVIEVFVLGAGAGGGSGRKGTSASAGGGTGGSGGGSVNLRFPATFTGATEPVVVGTGGAGGAAQTTNATNGVDGSPGGLSSFANIVGLGGAAGLGGASTSITAPTGRFSIAYGGGVNTSGAGDGRITTGSNALEPNSTGSSGYNGGLGGGGGGGANSVTQRTGGTGGKWTNTSGTVLVDGGTAGLESTGIAGGNGATGTTSGGFMLGGGGGGGGGGYSVGANGATTGGNGGNGGLYGGGGGGGGGGIDAVANSGAGGNGDNGRVIVIEYF